MEIYTAGDFLRNHKIKTPLGNESDNAELFFFSSDLTTRLFQIIRPLAGAVALITVAGAVTESLSSEIADVENYYNSEDYDYYKTPEIHLLSSLRFYHSLTLIGFATETICNSALKKRVHVPLIHLS